MSGQHESRIIAFVRIMVLLVGAVIMLAPFFFMLTTSFKSSSEAIRSPPTFIPEQPVGFSNYSRVLTEIPFFRYFLNSMIVATSVTIATLFTSSLAGYIFAKLRFWGRDHIFFGIVATMMIPFPVLIIPLYILMARFRLVNTLWALILPGLVSAFGIFLMRQFIKTIPSDYVEAARIDGASELRIYVQLVLPLCKPALAALAVFIFLTSWDDFLWPLVVIDDNTRRTLPLGLALFRQQFGPLDWNLILTGAVLAALPVLILFLFLQRTFIEGIALTGLKG